jgi:L-lactate utilization protein LutC
MHTEGRVNPFVNRKPLKAGRHEFLARVRKALGHDEKASPVPEGVPVREGGLIRQVAKDDPGRVERWVQKAKGNGMVVHRVAADAVAIATAIESSFANHAVRKAVSNAGSLGDQFDVMGFLVAHRIEEVRWGAAGSMDLAFGCDAAITDCRAGLADTGAILVWSEKGFGRSSTLVVPVHVVLLPASRIVADMIDGFDLVLSQFPIDALPSNIVVINGPSKTSDIEMKLVTGVHGPKYVYVVVIEGM